MSEAKSIVENICITIGVLGVVAILMFGIIKCAADEYEYDLKKSKLKYGITNK
jgi:hypothetical protein